MKLQLHSRTFAVLALLLFTVSAYADVSAPQRTQGLVAPAPIGEHGLVHLTGKGKFVSAEITKQGGANDLTFVSLDIDGRNVVNISVVALKNVGLTEANPYGLVLLQSSGDPKTFTIGFPFPLVFKRECNYSAPELDAVDWVAKKTEKSIGCG